MTTTQTQHIVIGMADLGDLAGEGIEARSPVLQRLKDHLSVIDDDGKVSFAYHGTAWAEVVEAVSEAYDDAIAAQAEGRGLIVHRPPLEMFYQTEDELLQYWEGDPLALLPNWDDVLDMDQAWEDARPAIRDALVNEGWTDEAVAFWGDPTWTVTRRSSMPEWAQVPRC